MDPPGGAGGHCLHCSAHSFATDGKVDGRMDERSLCNYTLRVSTLKQMTVYISKII